MMRGHLDPQVLIEWRGFVAIAVWPIILAGMAGYFTCIWPGSRPVRRILYSICFPAIFGLSLICGRFIYLERQVGSVLQTGSSVFHDASSWPTLLWKLGPGLHFCVFGILLVTIFVSRLELGIASLPVSLPKGHYSVPEDAESSGRLDMLVWVLVGPLVLSVGMISLFTIGIPLIASLRLPSYIQSDWFSRLARLLDTFVSFVLVLWIVGRGGRQVVWHSMRMPEPKHFLLGLSFPVGISVLLSTANYLFDRMQWAAHEFGRISAPEFGSYFGFPDPWLLLLVFAALFEEIAFRGFLQPQFITRYGLYRGTFLVSLVWAAFHFFADSYSGATDTGVLATVAFRIFVCLALGFVFSWLTLLSGSVLPAAVAHAFYNVLVYSGFGPEFPGKGFVRTGMWALLAYVLFRWWPVPIRDESSDVAPAVSPESAI
jgi:membrane protease YdiL (CAAX protease family)